MWIQTDCIIYNRVYWVPFFGGGAHILAPGRGNTTARCPPVQVASIPRPGLEACAGLVFTWHANLPNDRGRAAREDSP